ncbi:MAG: hypothetical protein CMJ58_11505 [Planctomycetaceae bacterium]|nr:hypothetical protein [Planctomycetaceae bacterium]
MRRFATRLNVLPSSVTTRKASRRAGNGRKASAGNSSATAADNSPNHPGLSATGIRPSLPYAARVVASNSPASCARAKFWLPLPSRPGSGADVAGIRPRGRARQGTRLIDKTPHGHWTTTTLIATLRCDGAINGHLFLGYVRQTLAPALRPGDVVVMDNLSSHKCAGVRDAIAAAGAKLLYLPPYSPGFNPIEQAFSKFKCLLQSASERTVEGLWQICGRLVERFTEIECRNYIRHAEYS